MASRLDTLPSKIGPSAQARYARRAMRKFSRRGSAEDLLRASQVAGQLAEAGEADTVRSSESRVASDALQLRYDQQVLREQEAALRAPQKPVETSAPAPATATLPASGSGLRAASDTAARLPEPRPGVSPPPVNKLTEKSTPTNLGDMSRGRRINPLTGQPFGYVPPAGDPRSLDERLAEYQAKYLPAASGDLSSALRASSARGFQEAARLGRTRQQETAVAANDEPLVAPPPVDLGIDDSPAFTPTIPPPTIRQRPSQARQLGRLARRAATETLVEDVVAPVLGAGLRTARRTQQGAQGAARAGLAPVAPVVDTLYQAGRGTGQVARTVGAGVSALLDRVRRGGSQLREFGQGITGQ